MAMYDDQPKQDCPTTAGTVSAHQGYRDTILEELRELQNLADTIHSKVFDISGQCIESGGEDKVQRDPQNFCEHCIRDLRRVRVIMQDSLDHLGNL